MQPCSQDTQATRQYEFLKFFQLYIHCWYLYFSVKTFFIFYSLSWAGAVSNMWDIFFSLVFDGIPHVFSFIYELLINALAIFFQKFMKVLI